MAIVPQKLFVIRDTQENKIMPGAKGQFAFDQKAQAHRSIPHTQWWAYYKKFSTVRKLMPYGDSSVHTFERMRDEIQKRGWRDRDENLTMAYNDLNAEIHKWIRESKEYQIAVDKIKFDKQTRYVVELLVQIETQEIK